jgi:undecaprenol kinase/diacylglycerol kinase (ATP)
MESKHSLFKSFGFAFDGFKTAIVRGRNFRIQLTMGVIAIIFGWALELDFAEWLDLVIVISLVLILELINTSLEAIVDLVSPEIREAAKVAKDVAAATVLIASIASIVIGVLLFLPRILKVL